MPTSLVAIVFVSIAAFLYFIKMVFDHEREKLVPRASAKEIEELRKRLAVLERIVTDDGRSLAAQIAALDDRSEDGEPLFLDPRERARHTL